MAIYRLLENSALGLGPKEVNCIIEAYEQALHTLCVKDRDDPLTEMIATKIIKIAQTGVHDAGQLSALAIKELSKAAAVGGLVYFECRLLAPNGHSGTSC
jgi:hypothetical protein